MSDTPSVIDNAPPVEAIAETTTATPQADAAEDTQQHDAAPESEPETAESADDDHEPDPSQFDTWEKYLDAKVKHEADKRIREIESQRTIQQKQAERVAGFNERAATARQQNPDFDAVLQSAAVGVSDAVMETILETEDGPSVAYYLAKNPTELYRLNAMNERQQVLELGRISARLSAKAPERKVTQAPPPPPAVKAAGSTQKSVSDMTDKEYMEFRRRQDAQRKRR